MGPISADDPGFRRIRTDALSQNLQLQVRPMKTGTVKHINRDKGFGFIRPDDRSADVFFHVRVSGEIFDALQPGDSVEYDEQQGNKGPEATAVRRSHPAGSPRASRQRGSLTKRAKSPGEAAPAAAGLSTRVSGKLLSEDRDGGGTILSSSGQLNFSRSDWLPGEMRKAQRGGDVEFEIDPADPKRARQVGPRGWQPPKARPSGRDPDRFLNPYNFVRPLAYPKNEAGLGTDARLLGRCPPPPLDRYISLSGRIDCTLTTATPVFVSDSHEIQREGEHRTFRFSRVGSRPVIPGTALRGPVRSVFEAVTNSCWEHVDGGRRLSRRVETNIAARLVPARLIWDDKTGEGRLQLHTGISGFQPKGPFNAGVPLYAAWVLKYRSSSERRGMSTNAQQPSYANRVSPALPSDLKHGEQCFARLRRLTHPGDRPFFFWNVEAMTRNRNELGEAPTGEDVLIQDGYYFCTDYNIKRKHDERFFFGRHPVEPKLKRETVQRYVQLLADYRDQHPDAEHESRIVKEGTRPSSFLQAGAPIPRKESDCDGHLVYAWLAEAPDGMPGEVICLAPVSVPRLFYEAVFRDRFPPDAEAAVLPCSETNQNAADLTLCPACRVFGWVSKKKSTYASQAYRSRVRFTAAYFDEEHLDQTSRVLEILSAPKPTTVRFYLAPTTWNLKPERNERRIDYEQERMTIRGRKFYRRRTVRFDAGTEVSGQNRTIREHLPAGKSSSFHVYFENLAPVELGALLLSLELDAEMVHRIGYGKPLGFGAVKITANSIELITPARYGKISVPGLDLPRNTLGRSQLEALKRLFRSAMEWRYGNTFDQLVNVRDLRALLAAKVPRLPVHYPVLKDASKSESYHWFVLNRHPKKGAGVWLGLADGDEGLPYDPSAPRE
jgi:CRISPR-associated protein (TIGR03986 family)